MPTAPPHVEDRTLTVRARQSEVKTIPYRVQADKSTTKPGKGRGTTESATLQPKSRPEVTQKGNAIIGDLRTDALHQSLRERDIDDGTLLALLVLALGGKNVSIQSAAEGGLSATRHRPHRRPSRQSRRRASALERRMHPP